MTKVGYVKFFYYPLQKPPIKPSNANYIPSPSLEDYIGAHTEIDYTTHPEWVYFNNRFGPPAEVNPSWYSVMFAQKYAATPTDVGVSITPMFCMHWTKWAEESAQSAYRPNTAITNHVVFKADEINTFLVIRKTLGGMTQISHPSGDRRVSAATYIPGILQVRDTSGKSIGTSLDPAHVVSPGLNAMQVNYCRIGVRWIFEKDDVPNIITDQDRYNGLHFNLFTSEVFKCREPEIMDLPIIKRIGCYSDWAYKNGIPDTPYSYNPLYDPYLNPNV